MGEVEAGRGWGRRERLTLTRRLQVKARLDELEALSLKAAASRD